MSEINAVLISMIGSILIAIIAALPGWRALRIQDQSRQDDQKKKELEAKTLEDEITDRVLARANKYIDELEKSNEALRAEKSALKEWKLRALEYIIKLFRAAIKNEWQMIEQNIDIKNPTPDLPEWVFNHQES